MLMSARHDVPRILASESVSNFGSMLSRLAIPWIAALVLQATPLQMGFLLIADVVTSALGGLFVGGMVDRLGKRRVMVLSDVARFLSMAAIASLFAMEWLQFWMLLIHSAFNGVMSMAFSLARSAWVAEQTAVDELSARNAQISVANSASESAAFASGGFIYQALGPLLALVVDAVSYVVSALLLRGVSEARVPRVVRTAPNPLVALIKEAREGIAITLKHPLLRAIALSEAFVALNVSLTGTSYMLYVTRELAFSTGWQGLIFATGSIGSLVGAAVAPRIGRRLGSPSTLLLGLATCTVGAFCIPLAPDASWLGAAFLVAHQVIGDSGATLASVHDRTLRQRCAPPSALARVDAALTTIGQLLTLVGALVGGVLASWFGTRALLTVAATVLAISLPMLWQRLRMFRLDGARLDGAGYQFEPVGSPAARLPASPEGGVDSAPAGAGGRGSVRHSEPEE